MRVLICDDNLPFCESLKEYLEKYKKVRSECFQIEIVHTGEVVYEKIRNGKYDLLFLDIEMSSLNGVEIGEKIRGELQNYEIEIIFISARTEYAMELFALKPFDFLVKPILEQRLFDEMDKFYNIRRKGEGEFLYQKRGCVVKQRIKEIYYFESSQRKIVIVTSSGKDEFYGTLKDIYQQMKNQRFFYCHKSLLVNFWNIREANYDRLVLNNGVELEISQPKRKAVRQMLNRWGGVSGSPEKRLPS